MLAKTLVFVVVAVVIVFKLSQQDQIETIFAGVAGVGACGPMIFLSRVWADYILPFGFWESFASDAGNSGNSAPAIVLIGWSRRCKQYK